MEAARWLFWPFCCWLCWLGRSWSPCNRGKDLTLTSRTSGLTARLDEFTLPVLVISGDDDRIIPNTDSLRLAGELPNAKLIVITNAGHVPHEERPAAFMEAAIYFLSTIIL